MNPNDPNQTDQPTTGMPAGGTGDASDPTTQVPPVPATEEPAEGPVSDTGDAPAVPPTGEPPAETPETEDPNQGGQAA